MEVRTMRIVLEDCLHYVPPRAAGQRHAEAALGRPPVSWWATVSTSRASHFLVSFHIDTGTQPV